MFDGRGKYFIQSLVYYIVLMATVVPISLLVSLELIKFIQCYFIQKDVLMYTNESDKYASCVSMTLHEQLAKTRYIFSDKTGTLTSNIMEFKGCTVSGKLYEEGNNNQNQGPNKNLNQNERLNFKGMNNNNIYNVPGQFAKTSYNPIDKILWNYNPENILRDLFYQPQENKQEMNSQEQNAIPQPELIKEFWLCLTICNEIVPTKMKDNSLLFQGPSPDEVTLVDAAKEVGFVLLERRSNSLIINALGSETEVQTLQKLEFSSERKCMSVIARHSGGLKLYIKGADDVMMKKLVKNQDQSIINNTKSHLKNFSSQVK